MRNENHTNPDGKYIYKWQKILIAILALSHWYLFIRCLVMPPNSYYGISFPIFLPIIIGLVVISSFTLIKFTLCPRSKYVQFITRLLYNWHFPISIISIVIILRLIVGHYYPFNIRNGIGYLNIILPAMMGLVSKPLILEDKEHPENIGFLRKLMALMEINF